MLYCFIVKKLLQCNCNIIYQRGGEDDASVLNYIRAIMLEYGVKNNLQMSVNTFASGDDLMCGYTHYDLIFLDIDMPGTNGIETGKKIRKRDLNCAIIYITNHSDYTHQAISVRIFGYIVKPITVEKIENEMNDFIISCNAEMIRHKVRFDDKDPTITFDVEDC